MPSPRVLSSATVLLLAAGTVWVLEKGYNNTRETPTAPVSQALHRELQAGPLHPPPPPPAAGPLTEEEFTALKECILVLDAAWKEGTPMPAELSGLLEQLADRAPFTREMQEIMALRNGETPLRTGPWLRQMMQDRLEKPGAAALRLQLAGSLRAHPEWFSQSAADWHASAGLGCGDAEFATLRETTGKTVPGSALEAGYLRRLARRNPAEAVAFLMAQPRSPEELASGRLPPRLSCLIHALPPDADFAAWAAALPPSPTSTPDPSPRPAGDPVRQRLASLWAVADPAAAAAYVISHPEEIPVRALVKVPPAFTRDNAEAALAWARAFPPGEYHDAAARYVVSRLGQVPALAGPLRELALDIQDASTRAWARALLGDTTP